MVYADSFFRMEKGRQGEATLSDLTYRQRSLCVCGLWSLFKDGDNTDYYSFSIITTTPNRLTKEVHDRRCQGYAPLF